MTHLEFDEAAHRYSVDGLLVPNVTSVLESTLDTFAGIPDEVLDYAKARGTAVHRATELYDHDDLDIEALDIELFPYLEAWIKFRDDTGFKPLAIEERIFNKRHWYAGTLDRIGYLFGYLSLIDIKSGILITPSAGPQTAAYMEAKNYRNINKIRRRYIVQLQENGTYRLHHMVDKADWSVFLSSLTIYSWRQKHGY